MFGLGWFGRKDSVPAESKVRKADKNKNRAKNKAARKARTKQRQKGLGKVKFSWSPGPNGRGLITEHQSRNK